MEASQIAIVRGSLRISARLGVAISHPSCNDFTVELYDNFPIPAGPIVGLDSLAQLGHVPPLCALFLRELAD